MKTLLGKIDGLSKETYLYTLILILLCVAIGQSYVEQSLSILFFSLLWINAVFSFIISQRVGVLLSVILIISQWFITFEPTLVGESFLVIFIIIISLNYSIFIAPVLIMGIAFLDIVTVKLFVIEPVYQIETYVNLLSAILLVYYLRLISEKAVISHQKVAQEANLQIIQDRITTAHHMHDSLAWRLSQIVMMMRVYERSNPIAKEISSQVIDHATNGLQDLRDVLAVLRETDATTELSYEKSIMDMDKWLSDRIADLKDAGLQVHSHIEGNLNSLSKLETSILVQIFNELLGNALRHGDINSPVSLQSTVTHRNIQIVTINKISSKKVLPSSGYGLSGLAEMVASMGGEIETAQLGDQWMSRVSCPRKY